MPGTPGTANRSLPASVLRDFLLLTVDKLTDGTPGRPGACQKCHVYFSYVLANMPAWEKIGSGLRPKMGKKIATAKIGETWPRNRRNGRKIAPEWVFRLFLLFMGHFSPIFAARPKSIFRRFFSYFRPEARTDSLLCGHVCNYVPLCSLFSRVCYLLLPPTICPFGVFSSVL